MAQRYPRHFGSRRKGAFFPDRAGLRPHAIQPDFERNHWLGISVENRMSKGLEACLQGLQRQCGSLREELRNTRIALEKANLELDMTRADERAAHHLATHDHLTSLPNRFSFLDRLSRAIGFTMPQAIPIAVLYMDLDGFKTINDLHGHSAGDEVLKVVSRRLRSFIRREDLVCRLGGDEFACLLEPSPKMEQLCALARMICKEIANPIHCNGLELKVGASMGIVIAHEWHVSAEQLIADADRAMYRAKRMRSGYQFSVFEGS